MFHSKFAAPLGNSAWQTNLAVHWTEHGSPLVGLCAFALRGMVDERMPVSLVLRDVG